MKRCCTCKYFKEFQYFSKNRRNIDGLERRCKECVLIAQRKRRATPEGRKNMLNWAKAEYHRKKPFETPQEIERKKQYSKEYGIKNRSKLSEQNRLYIQQKKEDDIQFYLRDLLRKRLWGALKGRSKKGSAVKDLGCSMDQLVQYLETLFYNNPITNTPMTWELQGKGSGRWQIDHIKPLISFDLEDLDQFLKANHYTNLRPLWTEDHIPKSAKERKLFSKF